jgi:hypothetical protein
MTRLFLSLLSILGLAALTAWELRRVPIGWEDDTGFHFGDPMGPLH